MGSERTSAPSDHEQILWEPKCLMLQLELGTRPVYPGLHLSLWVTFILGVLGQSRKGAGGWDALPSGLHVRFQQKAVPYKRLHFRLSFGVWNLSEMPSETLEPWELNQGGEEKMAISTAGAWGGGHPSPQHGVSQKKQMLHSWWSGLLPTWAISPRSWTWQNVPLHP